MTKAWEKVLMSRFEIINNELYWKTGRNKGQKAGSDNGKGYLHLRVSGLKYFVHKLAYMMYHGYYPEHVVDHDDHDRQNNSKKNLIKSTHLENSRNQSKRIDSKSKLGVTFQVDRIKWKARLGQKFLGYFDEEWQAIEARYVAQKEAGYHENHGNYKGGTTP